MRELKLRYLIELVSNIERVAGKDQQRLEQAQKAIQKELGNTEQKLGVVERMLLRFGNVGTATIERQSQYLAKLALGYERVRIAAGRLNQEMERHAKLVGEMSAGGAAAVAATAPPIRAYANLEAASTDLRVAMTDRSGRVSPYFAQVQTQAERLGARLPGTTKDYMLTARALVTQGVPGRVIVNGGLEASASLGALLDMDRVQAAETVAKLREAYGLADDELVPAADLVQRGFFGFGLKPQDQLETAKYLAPTLNNMGLTGYQKARETNAILGTLASVGIEGSQAGTNVQQMLQRFSQIDDRLGKKSALAEDMREMLGRHQIKLNFYDKEGNFRGWGGAMEELAKLRVLSPMDRQRLTQGLFGEEAGRPAQTLIMKGMAAYEEALAKIDDQASLQDRVNIRLETFSSKLEAATGTLENLLARLGEGTGKALKPVLDKANEAMGGSFSEAAESNSLVGWSAIGGAGAGAAWLGAGVASSLMTKVGLGGSAAALASSGLGGLAATALPYLAVGGLTFAGANMAGRYGYDRLLAGTAASDYMGGFLANVAEVFGSEEAAEANRKIAAFNAMNRASRSPKVALDLMPAGVLGPQSMTNLGIPQVQIGQGSLEVKVTIDDQRVTTTTNVTKDMPVIRLNAGNTNPGGYGITP